MMTRRCANREVLCYGVWDNPVLSASLQKGDEDVELRHTGIRNYYIYEDGRVLNKDNDVILKPYENPDGHLRVELKIRAGVPKRFFIHRLVYKAFIGELIDGLVIEHLDGNPKNNHYTNLRQSTQKTNVETAIYHGTFGKNHSKRVVVLEKDTGNILTFNTVKELIEYTGIPVANGSLSKLKSRSKFKNNFEILETGKSQQTTENVA